MKTTLQLSGLDCAGCAAELEALIAKLDGVTSANLVFVTQKLTIEYETQEALQKAIDTANGFEEVQVVQTEKKTQKNERFWEWCRLGISAVLLLVGLILENFVSGTVATAIAYGAYVCAYLTVGYPVLLSTGKNLAQGRIFDENFLMTVASVGAFVLGEYSEAVLVMFLYSLGETLQSVAVGASRNSVAELMALKSEWATLIKDGEQRKVRPEEVQVGDVLLVKAGEKAPVDGVLLGESALLDTKSLTGEAELKRAKKGEEILSGSINAGGVYEMKAVRPYETSAVARILDMVENAAAGKAKPEKFISKFARYYTPIVCLLSVLTAVLVPLILGLAADGRLYFKDFERWFRSALTFLVVSCPCALVISVPLTYFSGIGTCAKNGVLVKGAAHLDTLARAKLVAFDKTGTLTEGNFTVCGVRVNGVTEEELLSLLAAVERGSSHPIAKAFEKVPVSCEAEEVTELSGFGLSAKLGGEEILVGNEKLMQRKGISVDGFSSPYTVIHVAKGKEYLGAVEVGDKLRAEAKTAVSALKELGFSHSVILTGDKAERAKKIADEAGVYEVKAELLPDEKLVEAEKLRKEGTLVYVGDGINDAPVMTAADCAVSMGKLGSAAAVEASDFVLIFDDLTALPKTVKTARKTRRIVLQNVVGAIVMKSAFMVLGGIGILPLWLAVFADVGVMLLAVLNSFRVRF